jgi:hypothetical protein
VGHFFHKRGAVPQELALRSQGIAIKARAPGSDLWRFRLVFARFRAKKAAPEPFKIDNFADNSAAHHSVKKQRKAAASFLATAFFVLIRRYLLSQY